MKVSSGHVKHQEIVRVCGNFTDEFKEAMMKGSPAILLFDGKDMFEFATPPHIDELATIKL